MALGLFLILIVTIPFTIYTYLNNKLLIKKINSLEREKKEILERKILTEKKIDTLPIQNLSQEKNFNSNNVNNEKDHIIENIHCRSGVPIIPKNNGITINPVQNNNQLIEKQIIETNIKDLINTSKQPNIKEKLIRIDESDNTDTFIENLKDFRNNLNT